MTLFNTRATRMSIPAARAQLLGPDSRAQHLDRRAGDVGKGLAQAVPAGMLLERLQGLRHAARCCAVLHAQQQHAGPALLGRQGALKLRQRLRGNLPAATSHPQAALCRLQA